MQNKLYLLLKSQYDLIEKSTTNAGFGFYRKIAKDSKEIIRQHILNESLLREMKIITDLLQKEDIPHLYLKGPLLGHLLYRHDGFSPDMRHTGDIDILIPLSYMPSAFEVLGNYGYKYDGEFIIKENCENYIRSNQNGIFHSVHYPDVTRQKITVDLHFTTHNSSPKISAEQYQHIAEEQCKNASSVTVNGIKYPYLCTSDLLLALCSHFAKHFLTAIHYVACESQDTTYSLPLMRIVDIDLLLAQNKEEILDSLPQIIKTAKRQHCLYPFAFCVSLIYKATKEYEMIHCYLQEECCSYPREDIRDEMLLYCMQHFSFEELFQCSANELMHDIRCNCESRRTYSVRQDEEQSEEITVCSSLDPNKNFKWKVFQSHGCYTFVCTILKKHYVGSNPLEKEWFIDPKVENNEDFTIGIILSSGNCKVSSKYCAHHYAFPVRNNSEINLYRIKGLTDAYEKVDRKTYSIKVKDAGELITISLTLEKCLLPEGFIDENRYFDIYSIIPKTNYEPALYLSWNKETIYQTVNCMYCGKFI